MKRLIGIIVLLAFATISMAGASAGRQGAPQAGLQVAEAKLGKSVENRELKDEATTFAVGDKVFLWMKVTGGPGDVTVTWKFGDAKTEFSLAIGGDPWRTWANRTVSKAGSWTVTVTDAAGTTLKELTFAVQ